MERSSEPMFTDDNYTIQTRTGTLSIDLNTDEDHLGTSSSAYNSNPDRYSIESETGNTSNNKNSTVQSEGSNRINRFQTIPLPEGKSYHLFVSHRGDDSAEVWNIIRDLEQRFKIRCLYADRDFQPGKDITDNIKEGINKSMKTMLVISPGYLDSGYCWFELKVAFQTSVMQRQNSLIPVILKSFDGELPSALSHLTYIDCMKEPDVPARILDALQDNDESLAVTLDDVKENETFQSAEIAMQQNGAVVMKIAAEPYYSSCSGAGWEFKSLNTEQRELFHSLGIKIFREYEKLRSEMNNAFYLRFLGIRRSWIRRCCGIILVTLIALAIFYAGILLTIYVWRAEAIEHSIALYMLPIWSCIIGAVILPTCCIASCIFGCLCANKKFQRGATICWQHTKRFYQTHNCMILCDVPSDIPRIIFIRYDVEKCKEYLKHFYKRRRPELPVDSYEDFAIDSIETYLEKNQQKLVDWRTLPTSFMNRHNTFRQKACLCQLVLDEIII